MCRNSHKYKEVSGNFPKLIRKSSDRVTVISNMIRVDFFRVGLRKTWPPYRIGKRPHKQNRAKIHQKYRKSYFLCIFDVWAILRVAMFSYRVGGQVFPKGR